jgi:hypothetical protein
MQNGKTFADASGSDILSDAMLDDLIREAFLDHPELLDQIDQWASKWQRHAETADR